MNMTRQTIILRPVLLLVLVLAGLMSGCSAPTQPGLSARPGSSPAVIHSEVVTIARDMLGEPYHYGGESHLRPGDLVFFRFNRHKISHVGIYIGHHRFIHAPSAGKDVSIDNLNDPYWRYRFVRGGRTL